MLSHLTHIIHAESLVFLHRYSRFIATLSMVIFYPFFPYPFHIEVLPIQSCRHTQKNFLSFCRWNLVDKGPLNKGQFLEKEYMFKQLFI